MHSIFNFEAKIFSWKFRVQTCSLIGRSKNFSDGTRRQQSGNRNFVQVEQEFLQFQLEEKKWSTSKGHPFVLGNFCLIDMFHLQFQPFEPNILAKWKAPFVLFATGCGASFAKA